MPDSEEDDGVLRVGRGRRHDDHPDWKQVAPRWLLVLIAAAFTVTVGTLVNAHVERTDATAITVGTLKAEVRDLKTESSQLRWELMAQRIDALRFQSYVARKNKDHTFAQDLDVRLRAAERLADLLAGEIREQGR